MRDLNAEIEELHRILQCGDLRKIKVLTAEEVARIYRVDHHTISRWMVSGKMHPLCFFFTPGRHYRFFELYIRRDMIDGGMTESECDLLIRKARTDVRDLMKQKNSRTSGFPNRERANAGQRETAA